MMYEVRYYNGRNRYTTNTVAGKTAKAERKAMVEGFARAFEKLGKENEERLAKKDEK
jgi:hypothetical protein